MIKLTMMNKCASVAGHFDGHADALKQCMWHCPMQQIQCHTRCPWKQPSGNYLLHIALAAAKVTINKTTIKQYTHFAGRVHGHYQKTDTTAQLYCTLSTYVTPKTISYQNQNTNTTPQLYCTLST